MVNKRKLLHVLLLLSLAISLLSAFTTIPEAEAKPNSEAEVGTSTNTAATRHNYGRKTFYAVARHWVFYSDGTDMVFSTSVTSLQGNWSSASSVRSSTLGNQFYVWYELRGGNDYVHYVYNNHTEGSSIHYRRGGLNSNGTITWSTSEQIVYTFEIMFENAVESVSVDTNGFPFISFAEIYDANTKVVGVTKSQFNNGTWSTDTGFPYNLTSASSITKVAQIIPLTGAKMYAIWPGDNIKVQGRLWDGSSWENIENASTSNAKIFGAFSVTSNPSVDDTVHLVFTEYSTNDVIYVKRSSVTGLWQDEVELATSQLTALPVITLGTDTVFVWWYNAITDIIYLKQYVSQIWHPTIDYYSADKISEDSLQAYSTVYSGKWGLVWLDKSEAPYKVMASYVAYIFTGVYDERTGVLNPPSQRAVNVTAHFTNQASETFEVNGSYFYNPTGTPRYFVFNLTNNREYWLRDSETSGEIYIFDASTTVYTISFLDLAGVLDEYSFVSAKRYINGTLRTIEKRKLDVEKKVVMSLINGVKYDIIVSDGASYTFGDLLMTSIETVTLTLKGLEFPERIILGYKYVRVYATRNMTSGTPITVFYEDTLIQTNHVDIKVYFQSNDSVAWSDTRYTATFVADWYGSDNVTDYWCEVTINHAKFGIMHYSQVLPRIFSSNPWGLDFLGVLPFATNLLIPSFIVLCVAAVFSRLSIVAGMFAFVSTATILAYIGWLPIGPEVLVIAWALVILAALAYSKRTAYET